MHRPARFSLEKASRELASPERDVYISPSAAQASELPDRYLTVFRLLHRATARMAKLVDAWDLKSPARKGVPVRFRLRAPSKIKGLRAKADANPCLFLACFFTPRQLLTPAASPWISAASIFARRVASIDKPSLDQDILKGLAGFSVQLVLSLLEFKQDWAGPGAIGLLGFTN